MLNNKGSKSYGIVRMHSDYDTFIESNYYKYTMSNLRVPTNSAFMT